MELGFLALGFAPEFARRIYAGACVVESYPNADVELGTRNSGAPNSPTLAVDGGHIYTRNYTPETSHPSGTPASRLLYSSCGAWCAI